MGSEQFFCKNKAYNCYYEKYSDGSVKNIQDEIPFDLPAGWAWSKISAISFVTKLAGFEYTNYIADNLCNDGIPLFKGKNVQDGKIIYEFESYIPLNISNALPRSQISRKCLLTPYVGTIGNIGIHNKQGIYHLGSNVGKIELYNQTEVLLEEYVVAYMKSTYGYKELTKHIKATAQASISIDAIRDVYIAIPPSNEQIKISNKIDEIFSFISVVENSRKEIEDIKTLLKSKILELAIQGKLVPQDESDEPASVLLEHIRAERKAKLGKKYVESFIYKGDDNCYYENNDGKVAIVNEFLPFDLPDGWTYVRLENVLNYEQPTEYIVESTDYRSEYKTPVLTAGKSFIIGYTNETVGIKDELPVIIFDDFTTDSKYVDFPFKVKSSAMKILTADRALIDTKYAYYVMQTVECDHETHKRYWISEYGRTIIGLPPLKEQIKIVNQIEYLFSLLDNGKEP